MIISKAYNGASINWAAIMYSQLVKEFIKQEKCQKSMIKGTTKIELKKDLCHYVVILQVLFQKWFPLQGAEPQEKKKQIQQPQEYRRRKETSKERFVKNKRLLNFAHFSPKKDKRQRQGQPKVNF